MKYANKDKTVVSWEQDGRYHSASISSVEVQEMLAAGAVIAPQFTLQEQAAIDTEKSNVEARAYLASTDWMIIRQMERGIAVPADVQQARLDAINSIT